MTGVESTAVSMWTKWGTCGHPGRSGRKHHVMCCHYTQGKRVVYLFCGTEEICLGLHRTRIKHLLSEHIM